MIKKLLVSDQDILMKIANGDHMAFTQLYERYWPLLYMHVFRMLHDEKKAEDVVQETFTWLWQHAALISFSGSISSYLYAAVRHNVLNQIRREKVKNAYIAEISSFIDAGHYEVDEIIRYNELCIEIDSEIEKMPPRMREIFNLSRKEMLTHHEIAELLSISKSTVREQVKRALKQLRHVIKDNPHLLFVVMQFFR